MKKIVGFLILAFLLNTSAHAAVDVFDDRSCTGADLTEADVDRMVNLPEATDFKKAIRYYLPLGKVQIAIRQRRCLDEACKEWNDAPAKSLFWNASSGDSLHGVGFELLATKVDKTPSVLWYAQYQSGSKQTRGTYPGEDYWMKKMTLSGGNLTFSFNGKQTLRALPFGKLDPFVLLHSVDVASYLVKKDGLTDNFSRITDYMTPLLDDAGQWSMKKNGPTVDRGAINFLVFNGKMTNQCLRFKAAATEDKGNGFRDEKEVVLYLDYSKFAK